MNEEKLNEKLVPQIVVLTDALATSVIALQTYQQVVVATIDLFGKLKSVDTDEMHQQYVDIQKNLTTIYDRVSEQISDNDMLSELLDAMDSEEEE